jgi:hypothetical protein
MDLKVKRDMMYPEIHNFNLAERDIYGRRDYPHRNTMGLSSQDYHQFLVQFEKWCKNARVDLNWALK